MTLAPGARILVRDAEWLVRKVDRDSRGGRCVEAVGLSEVVRDKEAIFLEEAERAIEVLDPAETTLAIDESSNFAASLLHIESLLRQTPPTDEHLYVGHKAAMDAVPYQLDPAAKALAQPRQRILIADAVGLGKTLEAGILLSELIRRGRGKRILVVTMKSMLTQFQKEMWSRFSIPLTRLDSQGLQRVKQTIPSNHNPFYYFDKSIISVDTLKQDRAYRAYIEKAHWDIIVIDEAHNVAERRKGQSLSLRSRLAKLLASRSDTLVLLSATPHDGSARSFASLMTMLDPTAIANLEDYTQQDIGGLYIRRFKKDIQQQVSEAFMERRIDSVYAEASPEEEEAFDILANAEFASLAGRVGRGGQRLFRVILEKSLFSSPAACLATIRHRIARLEKRDSREAKDDIETLRQLEKALENVGPDNFSKYQKLLETLKNDKQWRWNGSDTTDRLVIFTERIETMKFLHEYLPKALGLKTNQVATMDGSLSDMEQQQIVEDFGRDESPLRLLIASDVAAEGINLHYLSHRMIHFDIPWSLMVFQQRNGRIDRYGQKHMPCILYLLTISNTPRIRGDLRILELLIRKEDEAYKNIGDPAAIMGRYDIDEEEGLTIEAIREGKSAEEFEKELDVSQEEDLLAMFLDRSEPEEQPREAVASSMPSLYEDDFAFACAACDYLRQSQHLGVSLDREARIVEIQAPEDLKARYKTFPREVRPQEGRHVLCADREVIKQEIARSRKDESAWPKLEYLWELSPVLAWLGDKLLTSFKRHTAPVVLLHQGLDPGEAAFLMSAVIPNRRGQPIIHRWFAIRIIDGRLAGLEPLQQFLDRTQLGRRPLPNPGKDVDLAPLQALLPSVVEKARMHMRQQRDAWSNNLASRLGEYEQALEELRARHLEEVQLHLAGLDVAEKRKQDKAEAKQREIDRIFSEYRQWLRDSMTTEDAPYIKVAAVFRGAS